MIDILQNITKSIEICVAVSCRRIELEFSIGNIIKSRRQTGSIIRSIFNLMLPLTYVEGILPKINFHECVTASG